MSAKSSRTPLSAMSALLLAWAPQDASAMEDTAPVAGDNALEEMVVVASRVATPITTLGVSVSAIDRDELELLGYNDLGAVLDLQTSVSVTQDGGLGKAATVRIRGEEGFRTRVLLDGINIADPSSPQISPRIEHLLTAGIQRIEILRGPQGLLYGADGGGVIAITTQQPTEGIRGDMGIESGADGFTRLSGGVAGGSGGLAAAVSVVDVDSEGFNARASDSSNSDRDGYSNTTFHGNLAWQLSAQWRAGLSAHAVDGDNDYDGCFDTQSFAVINDCRDRFQQDAWRVFTGWQGDRISTELSYERSTIDRAFYSANSQSYATAGEQSELSWLASVAVSDGQRLTAGVDRQEAKLDDGATDRARNNVGLYAEYQIDLFQGAITAGIRHDDNDDFGQHNSWRLSTAQPLTHGPIPLTLRAAVGTGFRAPSLYEIAYNTGPWAYAPAADSPLREEQSRGWEAGIQLGSDQQQLTVTWFDQSIENEIYFDLNSYSGYLQRPGESRSKGLELSGDMPLGGGFALTGNATWNETEDFAGNQRPYRPTWTGMASVRWQDDRLSTALTWRVAREFTDAFGSPMDNYQLADWAIKTVVVKGISVNARIENIFDANYQQVRDYNSPGRRWFVGVSYTFGAAQ